MLAIVSSVYLYLRPLLALQWMEGYFLAPPNRSPTPDSWLKYDFYFFPLLFSSRKKEKRAKPKGLDTRFAHYSVSSSLASKIARLSLLANSFC
jgi:hypothetical protein